MNKIILGVFLVIFSLGQILAQNLQPGQKRWESSNKLSIKDYHIKTSGNNNEEVFSQFLITHSFSGFDFFKKNLNQKIQNIFLGNASWIDTTKVNRIKKQIDFQQLQFDLAEIHARKFRKRVLENKKQMVKGLDIVSQINNEIISEFSVSRLKFIKETKSGTDEIKLQEWRNKILNDLKKLEEFNYLNKKKIKVNR